mmetsp:Transcript_5672/g.16707  ORF Transcript_5672/g.16707 Transcript_5672/m.16707 type:complete len:246 (-) Transcript_5672:189-926(-)
MVWICNRVSPKSAERSRSRKSTTARLPDSLASAFAHSISKYSSSSDGGLLFSSSSLSSSTSMSKQSGTNSSYVTMPSMSASTSCINRLISLRVKPSSASRMHLWNSLRESAPEPSTSALEKTSFITASSSSLLMPWSMNSCAASAASASSAASSCAASAFAYIACTRSTASGTNSAYVISPSPLTSASAITRLTSVSLRPRSAILKISLNSALESAPEPSRSASMNIVRSSSSSSAGERRRTPFD